MAPSGSGGQAKDLLMFTRWILIMSLLMTITGCHHNPDPSGTVIAKHEEELSEVDDSVLPPKFSLGDIVSIGDDMSIGIVISSYRQYVEEENTWVYSILFHSTTIRYTEDKIILVEKFDWNRPAKRGVID